MVFTSAKVLPRKRANLGKQKEHVLQTDKKKGQHFVACPHLRQETFLGRCSGHGKILPTSEGVFSMPSLGFKSFQNAGFRGQKPRCPNEKKISFADFSEVLLILLNWLNCLYPKYLGDPLCCHISKASLQNVSIVNESSDGDDSNNRKR